MIPWHARREALPARWPAWSSRRMRFLHRRDAGRTLGEHLADRREELGPDPVVLGLPRGGVPVAEEVARILGCPLDVIVVRKIGVPGQPELAAGAVGEDGARVINHDVLRATGTTAQDLAVVEATARDELAHRVARFRRARTRESLAGRSAIIIDDGVATGATARTACQVARAHGAQQVVLAVPVAPIDWESRFGAAADLLVSLSTPEGFWAVGHWYDDFSPVTDDEVVACLERSAHPSRISGGAPVTDLVAVGRDEEVAIDAAGATVRGHLRIPVDAVGMVVFVHGSGSSRHSPRNRYVAEVLHEAGLGTLVFDLLTPAEERQRANVFDIVLLERRLSAVIAWLRHDLGDRDLPFGLFGASTGAAAALVVAARPANRISAVVSRGGRPDLAGHDLSKVTTPTLFIVGGHDLAVAEMNRTAQQQVRGPSEMVVIPGASHLFEEPGTLGKAADSARQWFLDHLATPALTARSHPAPR
jgi:putative phosphoribosyl transferase